MSVNTCGRCDEEIEPGEPVEVMGSSEGDKSFHWECAARMVIGGMNHLLGRCTCCGGTEPPDPPNLTKREAARNALAVYRAQQATKGKDDGH